jgi:hypothetical protein
MRQQVTLEILYNVEKDESYHSIMGGDNSNPTWEEYMANAGDEYKHHLELIKEAILNPDNELYKITGEEKQERGISFKFSDGQHWGFSWRAWGDLMQAIVGKREGYMKYYM